MVVSIIVTKTSAIVGLIGAIIFAFSDSTTAATIAAVGTVCAAMIGVLNTWLQTKVLKRTEQANERLRLVHNVARDSATVVREVTGTERRKDDRKPN